MFKFAAAIAISAAAVFAAQGQHPDHRGHPPSPPHHTPGHHDPRPGRPHDHHGAGRFEWHGNTHWRYTAHDHPKWGRPEYLPRYGKAPVYWCAEHNCHYYWCAPHRCYYPVSYCPFGTYVFEENVTYPVVPVLPAIPAIPAGPPPCGCGPNCPCRQQYPPDRR